MAQALRKTSNPVLEDPDHAAIRAVISEETNAFLAEDFERWSACWVQDERTIDVYASQDFGLDARRGWDAVGSHMRAEFETGSPCGKKEINHDNHRISVDGDLAWAVFDTCAHDADGSIIEGFETRVLERRSGHWRIVYASYAQVRAPSHDAGDIAVDSTGQVIWASDATLETLKQHPALTISHGRLRARRPQWDKGLQKAIERAGGYHGFFRQYRFARENGCRFQYPLVLGEDEDGRVLTCHLSVQDVATYVSTGADDRLDRRLEAAQMIFGLSDAQRALAEQIASGQSLTACAEALGITINTARTHLSRIYEKTGVNAQTALVRLLLSVG